MHLRHHLYQILVEEVYCLYSKIQMQSGTGPLSQNSAQMMAATIG